MAKQNVELKFSIKDGVSSGLSKIGQGVDSLNTKLGKAAIAAGAATAALAAIGAGAGLGAGISAAAEIEQAMGRISVKTGETGEGLAAIKAGLEQIGAAGSKSITETASAFEVLAGEGFSAAEALKVLPDALNLATVAGQSTAEASAALAATLDQFGLSANDAGRAAESLAAAAMGGGTGVDQLLSALEQVGPTARNSGLSLQQTSAALAALAQNGIEGGKAGGALRAILDGLSDPASKFSTELSKIGISSRDFGTVVEQLGTKGAAASLAIESLGSRGTAALKALVRDGGASVQELEQKIAGSSGALQAFADTINTDLNTSIDRLKNSFSDALRIFAEPLLDPLRKELDTIEVALRDFAASPEFANLRESFRLAFEEGLQFVRNFIAEFDFATAIASVQQFVDDAGGKLRGFAQTADEVASAIRVATNAIGAVFNALQTVVAAAVGAIAQSQASLLTPLAKVSDTAAEMQRVLQGVADSAFEQVKIQAAQTAANVEALADSLGEATNATNTASEAATEAANNVRQLGEDEARLAANAEKLAEAERAHAAAMEEAAAKAAGSIDKIAAAQAQLAEVERQIGDAIAGGASQQAVQALITQANVLRASIEPVGVAAQDAGSKIKRAGDEGAAAFSGAARAAGSAAENIKATGDAAQQSATMAAEGTASLSGVVAALFSKYSGLSEAAGQFFAQQLKIANFGSASFESYGRAIEAADRATTLAFANQQAGAAGAISKLQEFAETGQVAGDTTATAFYASEQSLDAMSAALDQGIGGFELLDSQTLSQLHAAIDTARNKTKALGAEARAAVAELQQIGDQLEEQALRDSGRDEELAKLELDRRIANIEQAEKLAGAAGAAGAARAKQLAQEEYQRKINQINATRAAQMESDRATADARIEQNQRVWDNDPYNIAAAPAAPTQQPASRTTSGRTQATGTGGKSGDIAINLNIDRMQSFGKDRSQVEELARVVARELERIQRRRR